MDRIVLFSRKTYLFSLFLLITSFFFSNSTQAQCAGDDGGKVICDITVVADQTVNLFSLLGGTPSPGGFWVDDLGSGGLDPVTGMLNVLAISQSGVFTYTYTVPPVSGCTDNIATVTLVLGGYTGIPGKGSECGDASSYNLFKLIDTEGSSVFPHTNGNWVDITNGIPITGYDLNPSSYNVTVKTDIKFTYSFGPVSDPVVGGCPATPPITMTLTLYPPLEPGTALPINRCSSDGFADLTAVNLFSRLIGEDPGGSWKDTSVPVTGELSNPSDTTINVQNIYNNFGAGTYTFEYKLIPVPPICEEKTSVVTVTIEDPVDYTGITLVVNSDICENDIATATYTAQITQTPVLIPDGSYTVTYNVNGGGSVTVPGVNFSGGVATFTISNTSFQSVNTFTVFVTNIVAANALGICPNPVPLIQDDIVISPSPSLTGAQINVLPVCQNNDAIVDLTSLSLTAGNYAITYDLTGVNTTVTPQNATMIVSGGVSNFVIPGVLLANSGVTTVTIATITNLTTGCSRVVNNSTSFTVLPLPVANNINIVINDVCEGKPVSATISGLGTITSAQITYTLTGTNTFANTVTLPVVSGSTTYVIPSGEIPNIGLTTFTITNLVNATNTCGVSVVGKWDNFTINPLPNAPTASAQPFCETDNATVASLVPSGAQYNWYNSTTSTTPLASSVALVNGTTYYVSQVNTTTGCESSRTAVMVTIDVIPAPILNTDGQNFCGTDNPTIQDLSNNTDSGSSIVWYDAQTGGNLLASSTLLTDGATYYGYDSNTATGCQSKDVLVVTVSLTDCDVTGDFFIPDGFSPNGDGKNDSFHIPNIEFIYPNYTIEIYNRYGNLLFTGNKTKDWDGKNSTSSNVLDGVAANGVYFYVINFNKNNTAPKQGRLYLNR
ncbi:MAG: gliding motility-associated C-terminal domain-containing protein [Bacteroidota bacterium]